MKEALERHEFQEGKSGMAGCWFPACGQPKSSPVHQRDEAGAEDEFDARLNMPCPFKIGDRVRYKEEIRGNWPDATVTGVIGSGFTYEYDEPYVLGARLGSTTGGQTFVSDHWELAPAAPTSAQKCNDPRPDDGSDCTYGLCPQSRDGCSLYCRTHHRLICLAASVQGGPEREHVDFRFDSMDCCKVCGLVRPAEGWTRPCRGPVELSLRDDEPLTDAEVDAFLEAHKDDPVDEARAARIEWGFRQKLGAHWAARGREYIANYNHMRAQESRRTAATLDQLYSGTVTLIGEMVRAIETLAIKPAATPPTPTEPSVEQCLSELREMFPHRWIAIKTTAYAAVFGNGTTNISPPETQIVDEMRPQIIGRGTSLALAMAAAREFKEKEKENGKV